MPEPLEPKRPNPAVVDLNNSPIQYVDWIVTGGILMGAINLVLAALDPVNGDTGIPRAVIQTKLRMSLPVATNLHRFLGEVLSGGAGGEPPPPPNKLN